MSQPELLMPQHLPMTGSGGKITQKWRLYMQDLQDGLPASPLQPSAGGTGVDNGSSTITVGGNLKFQGAFSVTFTVAGITNLTLPTSGTLATTAGTVGPIAGTANQITASASTGSVTLSLAGPHNFTTLAVNGVLYGNTTSAIQALAVNSTATKKYLSQVSSGVPAWSVITAAEITSGAALTKADDTNVTLTLGGAPTVALLAAASLTLGWTGQLSVPRGGIGVGTLTLNGLLYGNTTAAIQSAAALTSGKIPIASVGGILVDGPTPLAGTKVYYVSDTSGGAATRKLTFQDGILVSEV